MASAASSTTLNVAGKAFFGSLCAGTFGLGVWQTQRYFEKVELVAKREKEMNMPPITLEPHVTMSKSEYMKLSNSNKQQKNDTFEDDREGFRRVQISGTFRHEDEVLVGPRGPPKDTLGNKGPLSGRSSGGMGVSPQGYYIYTPLTRRNNEGTILVNRGWVPISYEKNNLPWNRPTGIVNLVGVTTEAEQPRFFSPPHPTPPKLLWLERNVLEERTGTTGLAPLIVTETANDNIATAPKDTISFPVKPVDKTVGEFAVLPETHAGYAITWFGLSGAGVFMMKKMLTKGR